MNFTGNVEVYHRYCHSSCISPEMILAHSFTKIPERVINCAGITHIRDTQETSFFVQCE